MDRTRNNTSQVGIYKLTEEIKAAEILLDLFSPLRQFMDGVYYSGMGRNAARSTVRLPDDVHLSISFAASTNLRDLTKGNLFVFEYKGFSRWDDEIRNDADVVKSSLEFKLNSGVANFVDFYHDFDDGELIFKYPIARSMDGLMQQVDRFKAFTASFERKLVPGES